MIQLAILLTSYNRKEKTLACLRSVYSQEDISNVNFEIYLVDDNSTDGTGQAVKIEFPNVHVFKGNGDLFWAGGMRYAWREAIKTKKSFDYFLLLNDDTLLLNDAFKNLVADLKTMKNEQCILIGSTKDKISGNFSYGGRLLKNGYISRAEVVKPNSVSPQLCHLGNANIMLVPTKVVDKIGILSDVYTHSFADYDYTLKAKKAGIPSYICTYYCGYCSDDHGVNWKTGDHSLKQRIQYLYSHKGLAYKEYLAFVRKFFPLYLPKAWALLWTKTFFPVFWESRGKKQTVRA